ncbi:hypothetical protein ACJA23_01410 [Mycoplasma corogypsi]|uniref:hypothetical protein n=1 Tax=Mycoplasma corogypsi TaxID=2106 RepID=UPI00387385F8
MIGGFEHKSAIEFLHTYKSIDNFEYLCDMFWKVHYITPFSKNAGIKQSCNANYKNKYHIVCDFDVISSLEEKDKLKQLHDKLFKFTHVELENFIKFYKKIYMLTEEDMFNKHKQRNNNLSLTSDFDDTFSDVLRNNITLTISELKNSGGHYENNSSRLKWTQEFYIPELHQIAFFANLFSPIKLNSYYFNQIIFKFLDKTFLQDSKYNFMKECKNYSIKSKIFKSLWNIYFKSNNHIFKKYNKYLRNLKRKIGLGYNPETEKMVFKTVFVFWNNDLEFSKYLINFEPNERPEYKNGMSLIRQILNFESKNEFNKQIYTHMCFKFKETELNLKLYKSYIFNLLNYDLYSLNWLKQLFITSIHLELKEWVVNKTFLETDSTLSKYYDYKGNNDDLSFIIE